jgi:hypothetical protein
MILTLVTLGGVAGVVLFLGWRVHAQGRIAAREAIQADILEDLSRAQTVDRELARLSPDERRRRLLDSAPGE